jgi:lysophospholipase L1-like esterase
MKLNNIKYLLFASLAFTACSENLDENTASAPEVTAGSANFAKYVAIGNSITAGYTDGALFKAGQSYAFPKLLADQFRTVGGGDFKIPYTNDNVGGLLAGGVQIQGPRLVFHNGSPKPLNLFDATKVPTTEIAVPLAGPFNNLGVPGAKSFHLLAPNYGNIAGLLNGTANPFFVRFRSAAATSVLADALAQQPTFFSLWIGNNDVLGYATTGGDGSNPITPLAGGVGAGFQATYEYLANQLTTNGAKGVVANIPYVTALPHFTTVAYNALNATTNPSFGAQVPTLNATFAGLNQAFVALGFPERQIVYNTSGPSGVLIHDESITNISLQLTAALQAGGVPAPQAALFGSQFGQCRQAKMHNATSRDLIVLPASSILGQLNTTRVAQLMGLGLTQTQAGQLSVNGVTFPLEDKWVLLPTEQLEIKNATDGYNTVIKNVATSKNLAFVDANALMNQVASTGIRFGTFSMNASLVTGGTFSLDGVHLTARGNALAANKFMEAISATYGSKFTMYTPETFPIVYLPTLAN